MTTNGAATCRDGPGPARRRPEEYERLRAEVARLTLECDRLKAALHADDRRSGAVDALARRLTVHVDPGRAALFLGWDSGRPVYRILDRREDAPRQLRAVLGWGDGPARGG